MQEVFLDFDKDDNPVVSVKGVKGRTCKDLTAGLERKLGTTISTETTPEFNEREVARVNDRASNKR